MSEPILGIISPLRILVIDDEAGIRVTLSMSLEADGHQVVAHGTIEEAMAELAWRSFDLIFLDVRLGMDNGLDFLPQIHQRSPWTKVVVITAYASIATAVTAMKRGAIDYLPKPFTPAQVQLVTEKVASILRMERKIDALQQTLGDLDAEADFPTASAAMQQALETARHVAASTASVLIVGEMGTGKGRLARAIHGWSNRINAPFVTQLCQSRPAEALDVELFGAAPHESGGAISESLGRLATCDGGTLLLDEVSEFPPSLQPKLLHLLTDKQYERVNDFKPRPANVRVIATSSIDMASAVKQRRFRPELLLALDVVRINLPPLRERPDDIRLLARRYLAHFSRENHRRITGFTSDATRLLSRYRWPGNNRELRNLIERAVVLCDVDQVGVEHFPPDLLSTAAAFELGDLVSLETIEHVHVRRVLEATGSIKGAAAVLGVNEKTIRRWLKRQPPPGEGEPIILPDDADSTLEPAGGNGDELAS